MTTHTYSKAEIDLLVEKFNDLTLLKSEWTHNAHLIVAIWYLRAYPFYEAVCRLKSGIILLNHSQQTKNTGESGYHETLTVFWSTLIHAYLQLHKDFSIEELVNVFLNSTLAESNLPCEFYEKQHLMSAPFRTVYYEPPVKKIDELTIKEILIRNKTLKYVTASL